MRICIVTHKLVLTDGQGRINYEVARHLSNRSHEFVLVSTVVDSVLASMPGVTWREVPIPRVPTQLLRYAIFGWRARRVVASDTAGFDIVQVNGNIIARESDVNVAMFVHSNWIKSPYHTNANRGRLRKLYQRLFTRLHGFWERREFRRTRRAVALSELVRNSLINDVGMPVGKITIIMPGVDINEFRPCLNGETNPLRSMIGVDKSAFVIFFAGDLMSSRKNVDLLLAALDRLPPNAHLVCPGNYIGSAYPPMAEAMGLKSRVHFIGVRSDLSILFRGADVFAFPSHYDTFALVVTEAMATGLPVITTPSAGAASFITPGKNGIVLKSSTDLEGLVTALQLLATDHHYAREMGDAARARAVQWTWENMAVEYETLYRQILREKRQGATSSAEQFTANQVSSAFDGT